MTEREEPMTTKAQRAEQEARDERLREIRRKDRLLLSGPDDVEARQMARKATYRFNKAAKSEEIETHCIRIHKETCRSLARAPSPKLGREDIEAVSAILMAWERGPWPGGENGPGVSDPRWALAAQVRRAAESTGLYGRDVVKAPSGFQHRYAMEVTTTVLKALSEHLIDQHDCD